MKHIASCSFGKDSLAAIITRMEHGEPIDGAVYCRIMFDDGISAEYPEHEEWIHIHAIPILKARYGIETAVVQGERTYCKQFYSNYVRNKEKAHEIYGFPILKGPWCNNLLKVGPMNKWKKTAGDFISIVGIAADEPKRIPGAIGKRQILPLVDYSITEAEAFDICRKVDLLSPAYNGGRCRLGCWFCHNQRVGELRRLRKEYPALWSKLMILDKASPWTFKPGKTLSGYDERFEAEDAQLTLFDF